MDNPRKILVIQLKRAGDILLTTPVFPALKARFPTAQLHALVEPSFASLLENNPYIDGVQLYDKAAILETFRRVRKERYDCILDFQSSPRSALLGLASGTPIRAGYRVPFWGRSFTRTVRRPGNERSVIEGKLSLVEAITGPLEKAKDRQIYLTADERAWAGDWFRTNGLIAEEAVGLIPTHRRESRRWHAESFHKLGWLLAEAGNSVLFFWGPGERSYVEQIANNVPRAVLIPEADLRRMAALLANCRYVVTNDNGPMHLAVAVGTPTATVYGPTSPKAWNPGGPLHRVVQASDVPCLGCNLNRCPFNHECMTHVTAEQVYDVARALGNVVRPSAATSGL